MYMVRFLWSNDPKTEKMYYLTDKYRGVSHMGTRPDTAIIERENSTDQVEPTYEEARERFRRLEHAMRPDNSKILYESKEVEACFEGKKV